MPEYQVNFPNAHLGLWGISNFDILIIAVTPSKSAVMGPTVLFLDLKYAKQRFLAYAFLFLVFYIFSSIKQ